MENMKESPERIPVDDRVGRAYSDLMTKLFGSVPAEPRTCAVSRDTYAKVMHEVQERYGLKQGDPDFLEWVLTIVGRSPVLLDKGDIVYGQEQEGGGHTITAEGASEGTPVGEASSGEAD